MQQVIIPDDLSKKRYISGRAALNLPAPQNTTGDWHFLDTFYQCNNKDLDVIYVAGEGQGSSVNTNHIFGSWGLYECTTALLEQRLEFKGHENWAANHFRAMLDMLFHEISDGYDARWLQGTTEEWLDTPEQKALFLDKAREMLPFMTEKQQKALNNWLEKEQSWHW